MSDIRVIADLHLGHSKVATMRGDFKDAEDHDKYLVEQWNATVSPSDKVYVLGDVALNLRALKTYVPQLVGHKVLVAGNHDIYDIRDYLDVGFKSVYGARELTYCGARLLLTHIPVHPDEFFMHGKGSAQRFDTNIHGHLHYRELDDDRYCNVSLEQLGGTPISLDDLLTDRGFIVA